jgi:hypothetical protein
MKKNVFVLLVCFLSPALFGQKIQYGGLQQLGLTVGESGSNLGFSFTNGIRFKRFFTGIGADIQFRNRYYYYAPNSFNTSAIYADARYYINKKKNFFAKLNGGVNLIPQKFFYNNDSRKLKKIPGYYGAIGLGFKAKLSEEVFYTFDISYSMRQIKYDYSYYNHFFREWQTEKFDYRRYAITLNMGLEIL